MLVPDDTPNYSLVSALGIYVRGFDASMIVLILMLFQA